MLTQHVDGPKPLSVTFSSNWDVLGPFQIGTREASWGADPLESLGGFRTLAPDAQEEYPSSLAPNGRVSWSSSGLKSSLSASGAADASLEVDFPNIDWAFLQSVYGWAALQYQAWARGALVIDGNSNQSIQFYADRVLEVWVDDMHYFGGDFYAYRRAPLVLHLDPGAHRVDIRLVRDVRVMGGVGKPTMTIDLRAEYTNGGLTVMREKLLVPDVIDGVLASSFASLPVCNNGKESIDVWSITSMANFTTVMLEEPPLKLMPGQIRPLNFRLSAQSLLNLALSLEVTYTASKFPANLSSIQISHVFSTYNIHDPHKVTFLHPGGIVSYAILRAPSRKIIAATTPKQSLPILLNLHGAGLEADSDQVRHMLDSVPDLRSWVLFPTGVTSWSGDDWHTWGFADVESGAAAIAAWVKTVGWEGPAVNPDRWLISGHSNGGQGTWYALTHRPDKIIGAVPVSGYSSIQAYIHYQMWKETDPRVTSLLQASLRGFRHELLVSNFHGIPILQQHGSADDNVPAFHSRRLNELISQSAGGIAPKYVELKGKGHWFEGVMSTPSLRVFYRDILRDEATWPKLPQKFTVIVANPADMGPRGSVLVDQLISPDQLGKVEVVMTPTLASWVLKTSNILRFHLCLTNASDTLPRNLVVDNSSLNLPPGDKNPLFWLVRSDEGSWHVSQNSQWLSEQRHGAQLGPLDSILRTAGRFLITTPSTGAYDVALQVSRNLYQYFAADSEIAIPVADIISHKGNVISIALGRDFPKSLSDWYGIDMTDDRSLRIRKSNRSQKTFDFEEGLGAIFLRPLPLERLELVIWGYDSQGLRQAARLMPMLTGVGQPEFIIVSRRCAWEGAAGVLAMGSFDSFWNVSEASYLA